MRSRFISQPLAFDTHERALSASSVIIAGLDPVRVAEIELSQISVKVLLPAMLVDADHAALEDTIESLNGVGANGDVGLMIGVSVFLARVVHNAMSRELFPKALLALGFVGHQVAFARNVLSNDWSDMLLGRVLDMERASFASLFDKGKDGVLMVSPAWLDLDALLAADEGFINLDSAARSAERAKVAAAHRLADTMPEKPSGFHTARKHPLNLIGRNAFLAGAHKVDNLKPKAQRKVRTLEDSSLSHSELTTAVIANVKAKASGIAMHLANTFRITISTVRANWAVRPKLALDIRESGSFIVEAGIIKGGLGHGGISYCRYPIIGGSLCQV